MTRRLDPARFDHLAMLQDLATMERRRELEQACTETDRRTTDVDVMAQNVLAADARLDAIYANDRLCLDSLRWAAAIVGDSETALAGGKVALDKAKETEQEAGLAWMTARHRTEWFGDRARALQKKAADKRDETAEAEARALRLALRRGATV